MLSGFGACTSNREIESIHHVFFTPRYLPCDNMAFFETRRIMQLLVS